MDSVREKMELNAEVLFQKNLTLAQQYETRSPLLSLVRSKKMALKKSRETLLDCIQVFSDYFQRSVMLRYILCDDSKFITTTIQHLQEEFAHNHALNADRNHRPYVWDPILEGCAAWFSWKMFTLDQEEKTVLVHLVFETSANIFFQEAHKVMNAHGETDYFKIHSEADIHHELMGRELLKNLSEQKYYRLIEVQQQGWDMLNAVCDRIALLVEKNHS